MATSGSKSVSVTNWNTLTFSWQEQSQSVENNTTTITWRMYHTAGSSGYITSGVQKDWSVTINGQKFSGKNSVGIDNNETRTLASGTATITHNDDGTKTFSYSFTQAYEINFNGWIGDISGSGSGTLDTIFRASQPSCITWPDHTQNVGEFGDEIPIHMNRKSSSFTHTVRYQFGEQSGTIATGVTNGITWVIPLTLMNLITNATKGSGTIYVDTYNGNTFIGTKYCGFTATVPSSVKPSCSISVSDPTGNLAKYGSYVKGLSKFSVAITPTLAYSSGIKTYSATANGSKYTAASFTTGTLKTIGTLTVSATVTDGRGRSGSSSKSFTAIDYTAPSVTKLTVRRCNYDGTLNDNGDHVQAVFSAIVTPLGNKNTATYTLKYKKITESEFTSVELAPISNAYSVTDYVYVFAADTGSSYNVEVVVSDNHYGATRATSASTAFTLMHFGADGESVGILKVAERPGCLDIGGDTYMNGHALYGAHGMFDTRNANESPAWYMENHGRGEIWEFKELAAVGFTAPTTKYAPVQTIIPWKDASGGLPRQVAYEGATRWTRIAGSADAWGAWRSDALIAYPVGSIYIAYNHTNPGTLFGGTWERMTGGFLWASLATDTIGQTGGEKTHTLTTAEIPAHNHGATYTGAGTGTKTHAWLASGGSAMGYEAVNTGLGQAHNNMPPYIQVSIWRRTA